LHNKDFGGNLALKIDITKAFDTLEWSFFPNSAQIFWLQQYLLQLDTGDSQFSFLIYFS